MKTTRNELTRPELAAKVNAAKQAWMNNSQNCESTLHYATLLYQAGEFWSALDVLNLTYTNSSDAVALAGKLCYLLGKYQLAEKYSRALLNEPKFSSMAKMNLMMIYYQQNRFDKIEALSSTTSEVNPTLQFAGSFNALPYQLEWIDGDKISYVDFLAPDPIPAMTIEINGTAVDVFFDTGADTLFLDPETAKELGIIEAGHYEGFYGGGNTAKTGYGVVESVKLGNVIMKYVPAMFLPTKHFSPLFKDKGIVLGGAVGTGFLRQFLSTVDYRNNRLVLRERSEENVKVVRNLCGERSVDLPFVLDQLHFMLVRGNINDKKDLTFFVDSGLALEGCGFTLPIQTLSYLGIPEPKRDYTSEIGGGGGAWTSGFFKVDSIGIGSLLQKNMTGEYGALPPQIYWGNGYIFDGIISHAFLRCYDSWTIDFDNMRFIFGVGVGKS